MQGIVIPPRHGAAADGACGACGGPAGARARAGGYVSYLRSSMPVGSTRSLPS